MNKDKASTQTEDSACQWKCHEILKAIKLSLNVKSQFYFEMVKFWILSIKKYTGNPHLKENIAVEIDFLNMA